MDNLLIILGLLLACGQFDISGIAAGSTPNLRTSKRFESQVGYCLVAIGSRSPLTTSPFGESLSLSS